MSSRLPAVHPTCYLLAHLSLVVGWYISLLSKLSSQPLPSRPSFSPLWRVDRATSTMVIMCVLRHTWSTPPPSSPFKRSQFFFLHKCVRCCSSWTKMSMAAPWQERSFLSEGARTLHNAARITVRYRWPIFGISLCALVFNLASQCSLRSSMCFFFACYVAIDQWWCPQKNGSKFPIPSSSASKIGLAKNGGGITFNKLARPLAGTKHGARKRQKKKQLHSKCKYNFKSPRWLAPVLQRRDPGTAGTLTASRWGDVMNLKVKRSRHANNMLYRQQHRPSPARTRSIVKACRNGKIRLRLAYLTVLTLTGPDCGPNRTKHRAQGNGGNGY